jgi:hypothetical protein
MSNHTKIWNKKKVELIEREKELKNQLEGVANIFEGKTKTILIIAAATGGIALIAYLAYRAFFHKEKKPAVAQEATKAKKVISKKAVLGTLLIEKLVSAGVKLASEQLNKMLDSDGKNKK